MGRVIRLWDIDGEDPHIPSDDELNSLLENVGYDKVTLDGNKVTMPEGVTLDLGAAGKGIGCDAAKKILDADKNVSGMIQQEFWEECMMVSNIVDLVRKS